MAHSSMKKLPPELARYTLVSRWDQEEADAQRRQRALEEFARALKSRQDERSGNQA